MIRYKLHRMYIYIKNIFFLAVLWPAAAILRKTNKKYRGLWLVAERGFDARDNGYWFFRYLREKQPQVNTCYVIDQSSPDYEKVAKLGDTVAQGSIRHYLKYLAADQLISTHVQPAAPDRVAFRHLRHIGIHPRGKQVFLQHGIIMNELKSLKYPKLKVDFFASGGKMEYDYLSSHLGFPEGVVQYTGLCRYDNLTRGNHPANEILVMPTWRGSNYPQGEQFYETPYYKQFQSLLNHPRLLRLLEERDLKLIFYPHIELQKELDKFSSTSERVILASWKNYDVQTLMMRCNMMITDFSSVHFDVAYMEKPIIYYQFDYEDFRKYGYKESYYSYDKHGFGPVVQTEDALIEALLACARNDFVMEKKYHDRLDAFFQMRDEKNCERTFQALCKLMKKQ